MASLASLPPQHVFQATLAVERRWLKEVVRAVLSTILFHRVLGTAAPTQLDVLGISLPAIASPEVEELVQAKTELAMKVLLAGSNSDSRRAKLFVALYPTPLPHLPSSPRPTTTSHPPLRPSSPALSAASSSPTRGSLRRHASLAAQAAPAAVAGALGWFSARVIGGTEGASGASGTAETGAEGLEEGQEDELRLLAELKAARSTPWEGWMVEIEVLKDGTVGGGSRMRAPADSEDRLRAQLNDFLLRSVEFSMLNTPHVPPITNTDLMPYGTLILIDPPTPPFDVPKPVVSEVKAFPHLHKTLVSGDGARGGTARRAVSAGGRW
ncbi:hypothetical protein JCM10207_007130 [Rhodosporidiobolus poonsookiae]